MRGDGYAAFDLDEHFTVWPAELYLDRHDLVLLTSKLNGQVHVAVCHRKAECSDSVEGAEAMSRRLLKFNGGSVDDYATLSTPTLSPSC